MRRLLSWMGIALALVFTFGFMAPSAHAQTAPFTITNVTGTVSNRTGDVRITISVTCSEAGFVEYGEAEVSQAVGRVNTVRGYGDVFLDEPERLNCAAGETVRLNVPLQYYEGVFKPGTVRVNAFVGACTESFNCNGYEVLRTIRLTKA